ncbi:MAG TPA: tryptophan synthase subunit alpha [Candidatus Thermoplasmatota archaeon]|nr:tryptophan synthase subunit alpha [Candidatus Thermoplasmatota archaeon]
MSALAKAFADRGGRPLLAGYLVAGDPDLAASEAYMRALLDVVDVLEIGVPFSDPIADGPTIQAAAARALAKGAKPADALALAARLRKASSKPMVAMTYYNPILRAGLDRFAADARAAGLDGVIVPDLPFEESGPARRAFDAADLDLVQLASPATPPARMAKLAEATRGFLYLVSGYGVTGARGDLDPRVSDLVRTAKRAAGKTPVAVGFGVSKAEHVKTLAQAGADGVIVGSAFVSRVAERVAPADLARFAASLR